MLAIGSLLLVVAVSLLVTRVATVMLTATGVSREVARFQARSAFTGAGFTTRETESVVNHPVRRRIVMNLMLLGNVGLVAGVSSLMLGFTRDRFGADWVKLLELVGGLLALVWISRSHRVDRRLTQLIRVVLERATDLGTRDYADLLELAGDYSVTELAVREGDWVADRRLAELGLRDEGIAVLGVMRDGVYRGTPTGETCVEPGDTLVLYGRGTDLAELDRRPAGGAGDLAHDEAVHLHLHLGRRD